MENAQNNENSGKVKKGRGGYQPGGGRPKGSRNKANLKIDEILQTEGANLVHQAVRLAKGGNSAVLCKLLDKVLPTISENKNTNVNQTFEDFILELANKANKPPESVRQTDIRAHDNEEELEEVVNLEPNRN